MFQILFKIWYMIAILPVLIVTEGYKLLKKFLLKHNIKLDPLYTILFVLVVFLIVLLLLKYGYQ